MEAQERRSGMHYGISESQIKLKSSVGGPVMIFCLQVLIVKDKNNYWWEMSDMHKRIRVYHSCNMVVCGARHLGRKHLNTIEAKLNTYGHAIAYGVFDWQVDEWGSGAILDSVLAYLELAQPCGVWRKSDGPEELEQESWRVHWRI